MPHREFDRLVIAEVVGWLGDSLRVKVKAPPEMGQANEAVDGMDDEAIRQAFPRENPRKTIGVRNRE